MILFQKPHCLLPVALLFLAVPAWGQEAATLRANDPPAHSVWLDSLDIRQAIFAGETSPAMVDAITS